MLLRNLDSIRISVCGVESEVNVSDVRVQRACFIVEQLECGTVCSLNKRICSIIEEIKPR